MWLHRDKPPRITEMANEKNKKKQKNGAVLHGHDSRNGFVATVSNDSRVELAGATQYEGIYRALMVESYGQASRGEEESVNVKGTT